VDLDRDIDVKLAAQLAGVREEDFRALNPSLHKPVILAAGTPQILLPWDNANVFRRNLDAYDKGQYASWTVWVVPRTMTVTDAAQRVGMAEADLRNINNIPPRMLVKAGSALMVARTAALDNDVSSQVADTARIALTPEQVTRRSAIKVRRGDTIASVAQRYNVSTSDVVSWNNLRANAGLRAGQSLVMFLPVRLQAAAPARQAAPAKVAHTPAKASPHAPRITTASKGGTPAKRKR